MSHAEAGVSYLEIVSDHDKMFLSQCHKKTESKFRKREPYTAATPLSLVWITNARCILYLSFLFAPTLFLNLPDVSLNPICPFSPEAGGLGCGAHRRHACAGMAGEQSGGPSGGPSGEHFHGNGGR